MFKIITESSVNGSIYVLGTWGMSSNLVFLNLIKYFKDKMVTILDLKLIFK
jgi:hypothetical protein